MPEKFGFSVIDKNLNFTKNKDIQALLTKWDILFEINYFNFDKMAGDMDHPNLIKNLLENETVLKKLNLNNHINKCEVEELNCSVMNMNFLDRFKDQKLLISYLLNHNFLSLCHSTFLVHNNRT